MPNPTHWTPTLDRLAALAALAPSSHNGQPWLLLGLSARRYEREMGPLHTEDEATELSLVRATHSLLVCIDRRRALRALPALERETRMSVGGFASLLMNLLRLSGFEVAVQWLPEHWQPASVSGRRRTRDTEPVLVLHLRGPAGGARPLLHPLAQWIQRRTTVRAPYLDGATERPHASPVPSLPHRLGACGHWQLVEPGPLLTQLARFYRDHAAEDFRHSAAWRETYAHLHFGPAQEAAARGDRVGIAVEALFGRLPAWRRRLLQTVLHPRVLPWIGPLGLHARIGRDFEQLVQHSSGVLVLVQDPSAPDADTRRQQLLAGEAMLDRWLAATRDGLALQPLSVALQHTAVELDLRRLLAQDAPLLFIARIGRPGSAPEWPRVRRLPRAFCHFDFSPSALSTLNGCAPDPALALPC